METCTICNTPYPSEFLTEFDEELLCHDCLEHETVLCHDCGERIRIDDNAGTPELPLCVNCYESNYTTCDCCGRLIRSDDANSLPGDDYVYCEECFNILNSESDIVHDYYYKPSPIFYGEGPRFFGVELEIDDGGESDDNLDELDAALSSVSDKAYSIREGMKTAEQRMKELQKLMEYGRNYQTYKPIQDEYRQIRWKGKQEKFAEARSAELTLWDAANRYLHANLPKGTKTLPIAEWEQEYADLKTQRDSDYTKLKETRAEVAELQKIRRCVDIALRADQPEQMQSRTKRHDIDR